MILSLRKVIALGIVVLLSGVAVVWGLKTLTTKEIIGPVEAETTYGPVKLTVFLDKSTYRLGEKVNVTVRMTNIGNETVTLGFRSSGKGGFEVYNESFQLIYSYWHDHGVLMVLTSLKLEPGESYGQTLTWNQKKTTVEPSETVNPGNYYIVGISAPGQGYVWISSLGVEVKKIETPKVGIVIIP